MDEPTHRIVNGTIVELSTEEVTEITAEWVANQNTPQMIFDQKVAIGYETTENWFLPIDDASRASLSELRSQILEGLDLGAWTLTDMCPVSIQAVDGSFHFMTIEEVRNLIFMAGNYYAQILSEKRASESSN